MRALLGLLVGVLLGYVLAPEADAARARRPIALHNSELHLAPVSADAGRSYQCQVRSILAATNSASEPAITVMSPWFPIPPTRTACLDALFLSCATEASAALDLPAASSP